MTNDEIENIYRTLELNSGIPLSSLDKDTLKIQYYKLSRIHHPDKNQNSEASKIRFGEICTAYKRLLHLIDEPNNNNNINLLDESNNESPIVVFERFIKENQMLINLGMYIMERFYHSFNHNNHNSTTTNNVMSKTEMSYILCPSLDDLFTNKVFKLVVKDKEYLVPLWHSDLVYMTADDKEINVKCTPQLPPNVNIDENNNINCTVLSKMPELYQIGEKCASAFISVPLGNSILKVPYSELRMVQNQIYTFYSSGIAIINEDDIYDTTMRSNVNVCIKFV